MKKTLLLQVLIISFSFLQLAANAQTTNNAAFQVKVTGKGKPMLFIPGATCSGDEWQETVGHFSKAVNF